MAVRDPAFWRRFSIAVHLDEEAQAQKLARPELQHTYAPLSPSPKHHLNPSVPNSPNLSSTFPLDSKPPTSPSPTYQKSPIYPSRLTSHSFLSLNLTGRPASRIKFWTTIDAPHRESWLERQRHKKSRRTVLCWFFWIAVLVFVAGVVATILILKGRGIIK